MLELLSIISNLIQKGVDKRQAIRLCIDTLPDKEKTMAAAYLHKQLADN